MKLCKSCALKVHMNTVEADRWYVPGLYLPGAKPPISCEGCGTTALCLEVDPAAPQGRCQDCDQPKEKSLWGRCSACQKKATTAAAKKFDDAVGQLLGQSIRADIAKWAKGQRLTQEATASTRARLVGLMDTGRLR